ncbi:hypothetical protein EV421DRAFT_1939660, partial [Armillaria borealis]
MILTGFQMPVASLRWLRAQVNLIPRTLQRQLRILLFRSWSWLRIIRKLVMKIKLLQEGQSLMDASTRPLARLKQMGNEFICHLKDLKDDLNKIYGKTGFRAKMKKPFQGKAILDRINQHKVYVKDTRDKFVATAVLSTARQVTDIHNHLMSPSRIQPINIMLSDILPPSPTVFMGRDDLVQEGIVNLLADSPHSIIIMGFGGMGKTSLALKILHDAAVQAKYEACRYFIPCDIVCSVDPTVEVLLQTVMKKMNLKLTGDAVKQLHTISKPTILVFDNFETLWDHSSDQYSIQMLLAQLNAMKQIILMITMRGSVAPIEDVNWLILPPNGLSPVNESISLDIFSAISRYTIDGEAVRELVKELEGWPLAITLMAYQAKILSPKVLLQSWCQEKTLLLQMPRAQPHRLLSVDISIKITLQSPLLSLKPNILKLLSVTCHLPNGIPTWDSLIYKMLPKVPEQTLIISSLLQSGIIYQDAKKGLKLLLPIQEYLKTYFMQPDTDIESQICIFYLNEIRNNNLQVLNLKEHAKNIEWISYRLLDNNDISEKNLTTIYEFYSDGVIQCLQNLENICQITDQYSEATIKIEKAMQMFEDIGNSLGTAQCLQSLGHFLQMSDQYSEATVKLEKAIDMFEDIGDSLGVAQCLRSLGNILRITNQYSKATIKMEKAMQIFKDIGNSLGAVQCLQSLGDILQMTNQYSEATVKLEKAMQMFEDIDHSLGVAQCLKSLGNILYMTNQYSEATVKLEKAMGMLEDIGDSFGAAQCLKSLGDTLYMINQYSAATVKLEKVLKMFEDIGHSLGVAQCLQSLGDILQMKNQYSEATVKLKKAMKMFEVISNSLGVAQCLKSLGNIFQITNQYSEATVKLEKAMQMFEDIGNSLGAAQCLKSLGDILQMTNQYSEATVKLEKAMQIFEDIGHSLGVAQCLQSLGDILQITNQYSEAIVKVEKAMQIFKDIGDSLGVAQCLQSLGDILQMTNQYSEAAVKLEKAMQIFEDIGNSLGVAQCLQSLGDILQMTNQYSEAAVKLEKAMQIFEDIGNSLGVAQCLKSLGNILYMTNQYSAATVKLEKAMQMFEDIGDSLGAAQCLQSLGDILQMTNQYSEATVKLEKAMQMFKDIG